jgi:hypothetical protein
MNKAMAAKKSVKATKASEKKAPPKGVAKPAKQASKPVAKSIAKAISRVVSKVVDKVSAKKGTEKEIKKSVSRPEKVAKPEKTRAEKAKIDTGGTLLEMAKEEMSKVNAPIAEAADRAEKTGKFKPIKLERGNLADEKAKWQELFKRHGKDKAVNYKMSDEFEALKPINHKILGWGFVLTNENNRLEVLFENGIKVLISNYKA